jgi:hypothetical protein
VATFTQRTRTTVRHEYAIPAPANWAEIGKAFTAATFDMEAAGIPPSRRDADDAVWVERHGEDIIVYWEEEKNV